MSQNPKYIIFHIELPQDNSVNYNTFDNIDVLRNYISNGASQLLLHKKSSYSYLSSFLSFEGEQYNEQSDKNEQQFQQNTKKQINDSEFDEEQNEIRFIKNPTFYHEFSNNLQTLLITNNEKSVNFALSTKINYSKISYNDGEVYKILKEGTNEIELVIFDYKFTSNHHQQLQSILKDIQEYDQNSKQLFINIIISPFLSEQETQNYLKPEFRLNSLKDQQSAKQLSNILPVQTWQTYQGKINEDFQNTPKVSSLSIFYDKNGCRQDKITQFTNLHSNIDKLGFSHINSQYLFREITFKLGKLPKYGA